MNIIDIINIIFNSIINLNHVYIYKQNTLKIKLTNNNTLQTI